MENAIRNALVLIIVSLIFPILFTGAGAIGGLIVGWAFDDTYHAITAHIGWPFPAWQTGAALCFVGSHLKTTVLGSGDQ